jgi:enolase
VTAGSSHETFSPAATAGWPTSGGPELSSQRSSSLIKELIAWEALDSRGNPTVGCEVRLAGGASGTATVPSGASTGVHEARELRDGGERYAGLGTRRAVANVIGPLAAAVYGLDAGDQDSIDSALRAADGSPGLERLGANAVLSVSVAAAVAAACAAGEPLYRFAGELERVQLPLPMVNILSGGAHAGGRIDVQDVLAIPVGATSFSQAIEWAGRVRRGTTSVLRSRGYEVALVADEGGLGPGLESNRSAIEAVADGIEYSGLRAGEDVAIGVDLASSQFYDVERGCYSLRSESRELSAKEWISEVAGWVVDFPIVSVEDVMAEDDWDGWSLATAALASVQVIGDDLFATDVARLERGVGSGVANAVLVKPNQIGTLSDARQVVDHARADNYAAVLSARSGETEDHWLADLAVAWRTGQIKVGSTTRAERTAKWNRLLRIESEAGERAYFVGALALAPLSPLA